MVADETRNQIFNRQLKVLNERHQPARIRPARSRGCTPGHSNDRHAGRLALHQRLAGAKQGRLADDDARRWCRGNFGKRYCLAYQPRTNKMKTALLCILLTGCAALPGVEISEDERKACAAQQNCSVWNHQDLQSLIRHFFGQGYQAGRKSL